MENEKQKYRISFENETKKKVFYRQKILFTSSGRMKHSKSGINLQILFQKQKNSILAVDSWE